MFNIENVICEPDIFGNYIPEMVYITGNFKMNGSIINKLSCNVYHENDIHYFIVGSKEYQLLENGNYKELI